MIPEAELPEYMSADLRAYREKQAAPASPGFFRRVGNLFKEDAAAKGDGKAS